MMSDHPPDNTPNPVSTTAAPALRMHPVQKSITIALWSVVFLVLATVLIVRFTPRHAELPVLFAAPRFALTDQDAKPFGAADLRGQAYICDFIFTTCGSACPMMTKHMADLQKQTPAGVRLVSFTVNPEHDTPPVLKDYAAQYEADESRWRFLTGSRQQILDVLAGMKIAFQDKTDADPILHSEKFLLIDGDNNVRGLYDSNDRESMKKLVDDAKYLAKTRGARG